MNSFVDGVEVIDNTAMNFDGKGDGLIGHSQSSAARFYTYRIYNRNLTDAEKAQNAFVDLAKWYRIDISGYLALGDTERAAVHEAMKGYTIDTEDRDGIIKAYYTALADNYSAASAVLSPDMLAIARELGLDVSALLAAEPADRAYAESLVLADFKAGQPMERSVVQAMINEALLYKNAFAFEGVQVRLQSASGDLPGVRAIFSANKNVINAYAASGKDVAFGVEICDASGKALAELRFTAKDGVYAGTNTVLASGKTSDAVIREVGENSLAFAYTVTFGEGAQSAAYYETEFGYRFFVEVDGLRNIVEAVRSDAFDATVCAAEAYRYFYENGYADDRVVSAVIAALGE
jgi:hypothetical protein